MLCDTIPITSSRASGCSTPRSAPGRLATYSVPATWPSRRQSCQPFRRLFWRLFCH